MAVRAADAPPEGGSRAGRQEWARAWGRRGYPSLRPHQEPVRQALAKAAHGAHVAHVAHGQTPSRPVRPPEQHLVRLSFGASGGGTQEQLHGGGVQEERLGLAGG